MKKFTVGVIITDGKYLLVGHGTGKPTRQGFDIFKGVVEGKDVDFIDTAVRELEEESGIVVSKEDLFFAGKFDYTKKKDLYLYVYRSRNVKKEFDVSKLKCRSLIENSDKPEIDSYRIISLSKFHIFLYRSLYPIVFKIVHDLKKGISW